MKYILFFALFLITLCNNETKIWTFLIRYVTKEGAAGIMTSLYDLSKLQPDNYTPTKGSRINWNLSKEEYIQLVNDGTYSRHNFIMDGAGFGIGDWGYYTKKGALYDKCKGKIGDLNCQLQYLLQEFKTDFAKLFSYLKSSHNLKECTLRVYSTVIFSALSAEDEKKLYQTALSYYNKYKSIDN